MKKYIIIALILSLAVIVQAQITPEIELGAKGVMSGNFSVDDLNSTSAVSDFSDSQLLLGFKQKLYSNWRSQMVFGLQFPDADSDLGQVFYNHVFLKLENQRNVIKIGRSTTQSILNEFSTLRDDDAMLFNYSLNPFSNGTNTQDNQYGNVIEFNHIFQQRYWLKLHGENLSDHSNPDNYELNAYGLAMLYIVPESQRWDRNVLQRVGVSYNNYLIDQAGGSAGALSNLLATITLNINPDPVHFMDLKLQGIYNSGLSQIDQINNYTDYVRTESLASFGTIRYLIRKNERPFVQVSLGLGHKQFRAVAGSDQFIGIGNLFYRIGENIDLGLQYSYVNNSGQSGALLGKQEQKFQIALVYSVDQIFNSQFDDRDSILNLEYNYIQ